MGGKAFESRGLSTPRMPPDIYEKVLSQVQSKLRTIYAQAETPIEGPGKKDHGDIDVIVVSQDGVSEPNAEEISKLLGAKQWMKKGSTTHYALPWPEDNELQHQFSDGASSKDAVHDDNLIPKQPRFIQVDVDHCPSIAALQYILFLHAHADVGVILGAVLRHYGFVSTPAGFFIRIEELEAWNKSFARVKLTDNPDTILRYLGMDATRYWSKFKSWDEALDYVSSNCRFYDPGRGAKYDGEDEVKEKFEGVKAHDRSKAGKRSMFRYWLEVYLPAHRDGEGGSASHMSREEVVQDAKEFFGEEFAEEYDERRATGMQQMGVAKLWSDVRQALRCEGSNLTYTMKGLKYEIVEDAVGKGRDDLSDVQKAFREGRYGDVRLWAGEHLEEVRSRQEKRDHDKSSTKLIEHRAKQKVVVG